jgi:hypothetical protein
MALCKESIAHDDSEKGQYLGGGKIDKNILRTWKTSLFYTHARSRAHTHERTRTHTHTHLLSFCSLLVTEDEATGLPEALVP